MAIGQRLEIRQGQGLVMTPQLQQAIKLLQLSNLELADYLDAEIEKNPLLQKGEPGEGETFGGEPEPADLSPRSRDELKLDEGDGLAQARDAIDADRSDLYEPDGAGDGAPTKPENRGEAVESHGGATDWSKAGSGGQGGEDYDFESLLTREKSLREHLTDQLSISGLGQQHRLIAIRLIEEVDEAGYLRADLDGLATALGTDIETIETVRKMLTGFEPTGVFARDLAECLALQLAERDRLDPAMQIMLDNLDRLARRDLEGLSALCGVDAEDIADMLAEIRALDPRPGAGFSGEPSNTIIPDVFVRELPNTAWAVELNTDTLPRVLVDKTYYGEVNRLARNEAERSFISECAANANWLVKSLDQRARTILKVAQEIVRQQDGFFMRGIEAMRPLTLKTVAAAVGMHESTVSRVTSNKYMATPRGTFELKYFFTTAINATDGEDGHSAEAVRHKIKTLVEGESDTGVLSDDQIVERLRGAGIEIARRTVAKYRESLRIPSSVERRRLIRHSG
jgi:RNA polymerase sigma-54 factor